jgi:hypothetical protein
MLRFLEGVSSASRILPATGLLSEGIGEAEPYYVHEEEVSRAGAIVSRSWQRARWYGGRTLLWSGLRKQSGRGEGRSGLGFDRIEVKT